MNIRETITDVVERSEHRLFLVDANTGDETTYGEFHRLACALAAELQRRGLQKGDRVGVIIPNCCELAVVYFACIYLGVVIVPIHPALCTAEIRFILQSCKPSLVIATAQACEMVNRLHANVLVLATASERVNGCAASDKIRIDALPLSSSFVPLQTANAEDLIVIMHTSGTSAKPKGLAHRIGSLLRNATAFGRAQNIDEDSRFYLTLSMAYMGGFYNLLLLPFLCGATIVVDHVFDARSSLDFWAKASKNRVNTLWMAPTVLSILLRMDRGRTGEEFCRNVVRHAFVGFAPLPLKVKDEFEHRYGVKLIENYGLSETLFVTVRSKSDRRERGYVGEAMPDIGLRIMTGDGELAPPGADGEVQVSTPDLMAGYLDAEGQLLNIEASQWFATGDVGRLDAHGSLSITGRKKDLIIRGGVNVSPAAIEESLLQVNGIAEAAVVSIPHELYGEDIVAVLKLDPGIELESVLTILVSHVKENLAQHQQPARYVAIDELPKTISGKVQKARLRELVAEKFQLGSILRKPMAESASAGMP
jgi:acyl-coenzyme A synthetase/AMP-(fatty) acid ligase